MKRTLPFWPLMFLLCAAGSHAQMYKWVGPGGKVTYTDTPPPASAQKVETRPLNVGSVNTAGFPYELAEAVKGNPVTLYTMANCLPCDNGRTLLTTRGIPFNEKTVSTSDDIALLKTVSSEGQLPVLVVGRHKHGGFENGEWNTALTAAGYPESSRLPRNYRNPPAQAAAPAPKAAAKAENKSDVDKATAASTAPAATELPPATGNAPPGFRF